MTCADYRELLALYVEGDLATAQAETVKGHLSGCAQCERFCEQLLESQAVFKSLRQETASASALAGVRQEVLLRTDNAREVLGWVIRLERFFLLGFRRPRYAAAGLAIFAIAFASLFGLLGQPPSDAATAGPAAVFDGKDMLRPHGYREWVFVGSSIGLSYATNPTQNQGGDMFHNVYIDPVAYRGFVQTGEFPEGTVMVLEMASVEQKLEPGLQGSYEKDFMALEASVKDSSRFEGGWGYFGFTDDRGRPQDRAQAFPDSAGCRACHEQRAAKDHVFTQFYPVLRSVGAIMTP